MFIYFIFLRSGVSDRAKARRREIQYLTISTMWGFIGALLPVALPWRASRTRGPRGQGDWPPLARVVKVDKLAAGGREGCHQKPPGPCPPRSLFPKTFSRSAPLHLLPRAPRGRNPAALAHGATLSAGAGKVRPHLGDFLSDPGSHRVAVNMQHRLLCHRYFPPYHPAVYGTQSSHNAQLTHESRNVKFCIYVWWRITSFNTS